MTTLDALVRPAEYPRSSHYDPAWLLGLDMGPHPLWLLEDLCRDLDLRPGMRVLDLGSGRGATSVFLAREFGVEVVAADLWVAPDQAAEVFAAAGVADRVHAVRAEAHDLPFARASFDAIISVDAYEYFGTADSYLAYISRFLKPGGQLAIATPGMTREIRDLGAIPAHIKACVGWEAIAWHTADWWRFQWEITELVTVISARLQPDGWRDWLRWARAGLDHGTDDREGTKKVIAMLEADQGEFLSFALVTARMNGTAS
ncbi:SAM-dependent methyltransferase [Actinopolymorpha alba]|uniref:SAM-dependent methyltransferase n=1 Tax=Actinopolymorpha alba TaxID=533267 RepID=UPI000362EE57|nr:methyltransferase domain-containing protein [Actinopolymorpha alba]